MERQQKFSPQRITHLHFWTPALFTFKTTRPPELKFAAGQFVRLGLAKEDGEQVWRAYSYASGPGDDALEFYSIVAPEGEFSPRLAQMKVGDELLVEHVSYGFLTLDRFVDGKDLWMLATGTGLAPFISVLRDPAVWQKFERIFLVHSVRWASDLTYADLLTDFAHDGIDPAWTNKLRYFTTVTREAAPGALQGRITTLLETGALERAVGAKLNPDSSRIMVCGNPEMVRDMRKLLTDDGYAVSRTATPGPLALENQW
ncbi:Ferredoxin--NADP reductase [Pandoraea terrae]|uniref:ferredoxin--NADP(+) reductase n=1 Tax=Pandoraea terrae TaxID=1537710 RepID=A0A5E4RI48_9BURK|nr:ferredoxin--NADP reductase [Pandoraea terrae]VVD62937.1 Ferredoxin--NADP reductase [Pandoraea terrae]